MSALPPKGEIGQCDLSVRFVPKADILKRRAVSRWTIAMFTPCKERHRALSGCPARHSAPDIIHGLLKGAIATMTQRAGRVPIQVTGEFSMTLRVTVPTRYIHERYLGRPSCPKCGELLMAPEHSECLSRNDIRHFWMCDKCDYGFETLIRLNVPPKISERELASPGRA